MVFAIDQEKASKLLSSGNHALILLNADEAHFSRIFGKLEFITAARVILKYCREKPVPLLMANMGTNPKVEDSQTLFMESRRKVRQSRATSILGSNEKLFIEYRSVLRAFSESNPIELSRENAISDHRVREFIEEHKAERIFVLGFDTDVEVLLTVSGVISSGLMPIVVSDAVSSPSERLHFNALELMAGFAEVVDSREISLHLFGE